MDLDFNRPTQNTAVPVQPTQVATPVATPVQPQNDPTSPFGPLDVNTPPVTTVTDQVTEPSKWNNASDEEILEADLITELKLESTPEDDKAQLLARMTDIIQKNIIKNLLEQLPEDKKAELDAVLEKEDPEETIQFIQNNVPSYDELTRQELITFKRAMLTGKV